METSAYCDALAQQRQLEQQWQQIFAAKDEALSESAKCIATMEESFSEKLRHLEGILVRQKEQEHVMNELKELVDTNEEEQEEMERQLEEEITRRGQTQSDLDDRSTECDKLKDALDHEIELQQELNRKNAAQKDLMLEKTKEFEALYAHKEEILAILAHKEMNLMSAKSDVEALQNENSQHVAIAKERQSALEQSIRDMQASGFHPDRLELVTRDGISRLVIAEEESSDDDDQPASTKPANGFFTGPKSRIDDECSSDDEPTRATPLERRRKSITEAPQIHREAPKASDRDAWETKPTTEQPEVQLCLQEVANFHQKLQRYYSFETDSNGSNSNNTTTVDLIHQQLNSLRRDFQQLWLSESKFAQNRGGT